jgi:hypothetical protein
MAKVIGIITLILFALIAIPRTLIDDSKTISQRELKCFKLEASTLFDNLIEKLIIQKIVIDEKEKDVARVSAYTFGGLKYATAQVKCNGSAHISWRRWFGKS